ncbi:UbiA family prenyltransferase [Ferrovibrio sp.]|uniref:UbiA family prenyltransferase n=1 Tax=Ferrovibrio sp. TaxID=1917215 RepID=UPI003D10B82D
MPLARHGSQELTQELLNQSGSEAVPLVVDLDGSLIRSDILHESCVQLFALQPLRIFQLPGWLARGKAALKTALADAVDLDVSQLPINESVLDFLRAEKAGGRRIILASASHRRHVQAFAEHLGLFDGILATEGEINLAGTSKARKLVEQFGTGGFDYIGDSDADIEVWRHARHAYAVNPSAQLERKLRAIHPDAMLIRGEVPQARDYLRALRPHQWAKNTLLFLPMLAAHAIAAESLLRLVPAFVGFCLVASAVYLLNDLIDLSNDRDHHSKRLRPLASGAIPILHAALLCPALLAVGLASAVFVSAPFLALISAYFLLTTAYSLYLKRTAIIDAMALAGLYTLRVFAGAVVLDLPISPWMLAFCLFLFLSLALIKRYTELDARARRRKTTIAGRGYLVDDMPLIEVLAGASGYAAVVVLALYVNAPVVSALYLHPEGLWLICLLLLYWISRILLLAHRGQMHEDPVVFALKDRVSLITALLCAVIVAASSLQ